jgi:hypothetical protein
MTEIFSFYSTTPNQGKRTLSHSFAQLLAQNKFSVLYVELDTLHPSIYASTQITNPQKNVVEYFHETINRNNFNVEPFILNHEILSYTDNRQLKRIYAEIPNNLDYLTLPENFNINSFPNLFDETLENPENEAHEYIQKFIYSLRTSKYSYVILNLPNDIQNIFGFEIIEGSDQILNITTASPSRLDENKKIVNYLNLNISGLEDKWSTVINMTSPYIEEHTFSNLIKEEPFIIPYDPERQNLELSLENGSPVINERLERLALKLNIVIEPTPQKKKLAFSLFGKGQKNEESTQI